MFPLYFPHFCVGSYHTCERDLHRMAEEKQKIITNVEYTFLLLTKENGALERSPLRLTTFQKLNYDRFAYYMKS